MNAMISDIKGVLTLNKKTFERFLAAENPLKLGIFYLFLCFLVVALPTFVSQLIENLQPFTPVEAAAFEEQFFSGFDQAMQFMPQDEEFQTIFMQQFRENFGFGLDIAVAIEALPQPLPKPVGGFLQAFGNWLSSPLAHLGAWMGYAIWVLLFAKMAGGRGGLNPFLGLTALYAVPNLLGFFSFIPYLGGVISFIGVVWGWIVYIRAVQISQEFSDGKALLIAVLPVLLFILVVLIFTVISVAGIIFLVSGSN